MKSKGKETQGWNQTQVVELDTRVELDTGVEGGAIQEWSYGHRGGARHRWLVEL